MGRFGRLVHAVVTLAVVWVLYSSYIWWQMLLVKVIAENQEDTPDADEKVGIGLYLFLGGIGWTMLMFIVGNVLHHLVFAATEGCVNSNYGLDDVNVFMNGVLLVIAYCVLVSVSFQDPVGQYRKNLMNVKALNAGGVGLAACYKDNSHALKVPNNTNWMFLEGSGWTVNASNVSYTSEGSWRYGIAPIIYNGSSYDYSLFGTSNDTAFLKSNDTNFQCKFDPPIYATCASPDGFKLSTCRWEMFNATKKGYTLSIRKSRWGTFFDTTERDRFPKPRRPANATAWSPEDVVFDFDTYSIFETRDQVDEVASDEYHMRRRIMFIWIGISIVCLLVYIKVVWGVVEDDSVPSEREPYEMDSAGSRTPPPQARLQRYSQSSPAQGTPDASPIPGVEVYDPRAQTTLAPAQGRHFKGEDLVGATHHNATIEECDVIDCKLVNCNVKKVDFKGAACHLENCTVRETDIYCKVTVTGGTFDWSSVKSGGQLQNLGGCVVRDVDGY
eukprot:TRINITY_DN6022_c0_g2_i4.p1 TRINITY_DN6022_c0_g2~~TRINITY_DN6022_c0_g2_i4.p1  ORF type:complete len:499 (+),score=92.39 TRINITY_DN6022_c0_g2_i4:53-1549(+)